MVVVSREDAWPLRVALLVRHLDDDVPIIVTISDAAVGPRSSSEEIDNCTITSLADIVAPSLAGPCLDDDLAAVVDGDPPQGLRCDDGGSSRPRCPRSAPARRARWPRAILQPFDKQRRARLLRRRRPLRPSSSSETVSAAIVLDQAIVDAFYGAVKTLVTRGSRTPRWRTGRSGSRSRSR